MDGKTICNMALLSIGEEIITESETDPASFTGTGPVTVACKELYAPYRNALLEMFDWRFAARLISLDIDDYYFDISGATAADPVVITATGHPFCDYKYVYIADVAGMTELNGNTYRIANADPVAGTFELEDVDGSAYTAYTSGGTVRLRPPFGFEYEFPLPADYLKDVRIHAGDAYYDTRSLVIESAPYEIKEGFMQTDATEIELEYIGLVTDAGKFSALFVKSLANYLAIPLAIRVADSKNLKQIARDEFWTAIGDAGQSNAFIGKPDQGARIHPDNNWQTAGRIG